MLKTLCHFIVTDTTYLPNKKNKILVAQIPQVISKNITNLWYLYNS